MATFTQALEWLKQGRKVCREQWMHSSHIRLVGDAIDGDIKLFHSLDRLGGSYRDLCPQDVFATDWQLYDDGQNRDISDGGEGSTKSNSVSESDAVPSADTSLTTEFSVSPSLAAKILKLVEKENKRKPRRRRRRGKIGRPKGAKDLKPRKRRKSR